MKIGLGKDFKGFMCHHIKLSEAFKSGDSDTVRTIIPEAALGLAISGSSHAEGLVTRRRQMKRQR